VRADGPIFIKLSLARGLDDALREKLTRGVVATIAMARDTPPRTEPHLCPRVFMTKRGANCEVVLVRYEPLPAIGGGSLTSI
jgi:hypothetical protein